MTFQCHRGPRRLRGVGDKIFLHAAGPGLVFSDDGGFLVHAICHCHFLVICANHEGVPGSVSDVPDIYACFTHLISGQELLCILRLFEPLHTAPEKRKLYKKIFFRN